MLLLTLWATHSNKWRRDLLIPMSVVILCVKLSYFYDREQSFNYQTASSLKSLKLMLQDSKILSVYLPLVGLAFIEW